MQSETSKRSNKNETCSRIGKYVELPVANAVIISMQAAAACEATVCRSKYESAMNLCMLCSKLYSSRDECLRDLALLKNALP